MMYTNLHTLKSGESLFTLYITDAPAGTPERDLWVEEVEVIAPSRARVAGIIEAATEALEDYSEVRVVGIVNQSEGYVVAENKEGDLR